LLQRHPVADGERAACDGDVSVRPLPPGGNTHAGAQAARRDFRYDRRSSRADAGARRGIEASGVVAVFQQHMPGSWGLFFCWRNERRSGMVKVEAVVIRERVETVIDAVEEATGHVGVTVVEAVGHGRQRGITHEYRGRVFESRFLPKAVLTFLVRDEIADAVQAAVSDAARSGNESGDGIVWREAVTNVVHNRTGLRLEEVEARV